LVLPEPFGPTIAESPLLKVKTVLSANDLKPIISKRERYI
jgi:hypothetical protein